MEPHTIAIEIRMHKNRAPRLMLFEHVFAIVSGVESTLILSDFRQFRFQLSTLVSDMRLTVVADIRTIGRDDACT